MCNIRQDTTLTEDGMDENSLGTSDLSDNDLEFGGGDDNRECKGSELVDPNSPKGSSCEENVQSSTISLRHGELQKLSKRNMQLWLSVTVSQRLSISPRQSAYSSA